MLRANALPRHSQRKVGTTEGWIRNRVPRCRHQIKSKAEEERGRSGLPEDRGEGMRDCAHLFTRRVLY